MANSLSRTTHDTLPSNNEKNSREEVNAVTFRNEKKLEKIEKKPKEKERKSNNVVDESPKIDEFELSKLVSEVKAYKHKVPFPARLK